jgi:hypothetical protein
LRVTRISPGEKPSAAVGEVARRKVPASGTVTVRVDGDASYESSASGSSRRSGRRASGKAGGTRPDWSVAVEEQLVVMVDSRAENVALGLRSETGIGRRAVVLGLHSRAWCAVSARPDGELNRLGRAALKVCTVRKAIYVILVAVRAVIAAISR